MKKIPCLFVRDFTNKRRPLITEQVTPGCEWVLSGEGIATRKMDGTACLVSRGKLFKRYDANSGKQPPPGFVPADEPDSVTGRWPGWVPVDLTNPDSADVWHALTWWQQNVDGLGTSDGTYELFGPKINSNSERLAEHAFLRHGAIVLEGVPRTFADLKVYLSTARIEGIVFWRNEADDCEKVKIRRDDFGFDWPVS